MKRLVATLRCDALLQFRAGFYYVGGFVALFYLGLLQLLPEDERINLPLLIPVALLFNVIITTFYFVSALVLLEKAEGTPSALVVTPLRAGEYLTSKIATLTLLAMGENAIVLLLFYGLGFEPVPLVAGVVLLCSLFTLVGFAIITRYESINEFLMPSIVVVTVLTLPVLEHFGAVAAPFDRLFYAHPVQPSLVLMRSAFGQPGLGQLLYGFVGGIGWLALAYVAARRAYHSFVVTTA